MILKPHKQYFRGFLAFFDPYRFWQKDSLSTPRTPVEPGGAIPIQRRGEDHWGMASLPSANDVYSFRHRTWPIEIVHFPIKHCDFPVCYEPLLQLLNLLRGYLELVFGSKYILRGYLELYGKEYPIRTSIDWSGGNRHGKRWFFISHIWGFPLELRFNAVHQYVVKLE